MKSLHKALDILELFTNGKGEMALGEIAEQSGFNKATVSRIASSLVKRGYLAQREKRGKYSLGMVFLHFSGIIKSRIKLREIAIPHLVKLGEIVGESTTLAVWDGREVMLIEIIHQTTDASSPLKVIMDEGTGPPLHCTSVGKVILAHMTEEELKNYFTKDKLQTFTSNTVTKIGEMKKHLALIRREGVGTDDEEFAIGVRGIAAALRNGEGSIIGVIGILAPSVRMSLEHMKEISPDIKDCASAISRELGYQGNHKTRTRKK